MRRAPFLMLLLGAVALLLALLLGLAAGVAMMPSYLAAWLFWSALPIGALPLLMALEIAGGVWSLPLLAALRRLALLTPVAALLMIPVLLRLHGLYAWAHGARPEVGIAQAWLAPSWFIVRAIVYLAIWTALALLFARPATPARAPRRRALAGVGLLVHVVVATLAAVDWTMSLEPHWVSAEFGLLVIAAQCCIALAASILIAGSGWEAEAMLSQAGALLLAVAAAWLYFQFMQFLVIWSADRPSEVAWYLRRDGDGGRVVEWLGFLCGFAVPCAILVSAGLRRHLSVVALAASLILFAHALEMLWLVTPVFRQHFSLRGSDVLAMVGIGGVAVGAAMLLAPRRQVRHG